MRKTTIKGIYSLILYFTLNRFPVELPQPVAASSFSNISRVMTVLAKLIITPLIISGIVQMWIFLVSIGLTGSSCLVKALFKANLYIQQRGKQRTVGCLCEGNVLIM